MKLAFPVYKPLVTCTLTPLSLLSPAGKPLCRRRGADLVTAWEHLVSLAQPQLSHDKSWKQGLANNATSWVLQSRHVLPNQITGSFQVMRYSSCSHGEQICCHRFKERVKFIGEVQLIKIAVAKSHISNCWFQDYIIIWQTQSGDKTRQHHLE